MAFNNKEYKYTNVTAADPTTTVVVAGRGVLHSITFNKPVATGVVTMYDNASAASGTKIGTITTPASPMPLTLVYDVCFANGLVVTTATAAQDITFSWAQ